MTYNPDLECLKAKHALLDRLAREEERHPWKNYVRIEELKKAKLKEKDKLLRIHHLSRLS